MDANLPFKMQLNFTERPALRTLQSNQGAFTSCIANPPYGRPSRYFSVPLLCWAVSLKVKPIAEDQVAEEPAALDTFFDPAVIQTIVLDIAPADRQAMFDALPERIYVPATFTWGDIRLENVGVRFKGNSSSQPEAWWKRGC